MNPRLLLVPVALLCTTASVGSAVSAAAAPLHAPATRVSYADLNLASEAGRATLERRVSAAAGSLCRIKGYAHLAAIRAADDCFDAAVDQAMSQVRFATSGTTQFAAVQGSAGDR